MNAVFLLGKLPAHGDFVCRGLEADARQPLDAWLCEGLAAAQAELGDRFEAAFDAAPPWRFRWQDGGVWAAGAMAPSADSVGRRFPILVGRRGVAAKDADAAAQACETALFAAICDGWSADRTVEAVAASPATGDGADPEEEWWVDGGEEAGIAPLPGRLPPRLLSVVLAAAAGRP